MSNLVEKIDKLQSQLKALQARQHAQDARARAQVSELNRRLDTRRKILMGSFVLAAQADPLELTVGGRQLSDFLIRDADRKAFGLAPLSKEESSGE